MEIDYEKIITDKTSDLNTIKGLQLDEILVHAVVDEINIVHLRFGNIWYSAHGLMGPEVIGFSKKNEQFKKRY